MKAAIYTRYSSENQRETSLEDQERLCRQEAEHLGYTVTKVYKDAALSGQLGEDQRPGFQAAMEAAKRKEFDVLIADDASRLSRNAGDALKIQERLRFLGIGLVARSDGINTVTNPKNSELVFGIKSVINREFLRDLGEKTWRGLEGRARAGLNPGGLPYGYRSEPVYDNQKNINGYKRTVYEPEAKVVRRIFRLYVGDTGGKPHSARQIAVLLNEEGIAPPGARWKNRTVRQARTWSYTAIIGHRRRLKGILNNRLYVGKQVWNKTRWLHDPDTKQYGYRVRPVGEWVTVEVPDLRIVPQALWERAQTRLALHDVPRDARGRRNVGKYLLSGFVKCAVCGGAYVKNNHSYRCGNHRNRGNRACTNTRGVTAERLQRIVIATLREKLYTPENLKAIIARVRDELLARAKQEERAQAAQPDERTKQLREVEREIENIKSAIRQGVLTPTTKTMLEDAERRHEALQTGQVPERRDDLQARIERVLAELPERVGEYLEGLEKLLAQDQVERGKDILASLGTEILISPDGTAEIRGDLRKALTLVSGRRDKSVVLWLGEEDSNPR